MTPLEPNERAALLRELASSHPRRAWDDHHPRRAEIRWQDADSTTGWAWEHWAIGIMVGSIVLNGVFRLLELTESLQ